MLMQAELSSNDNTRLLVRPKIMSVVSSLDVVDSALLAVVAKDEQKTKKPQISATVETLRSEMLSGREALKGDKGGKRALKALLNRLRWRKYASAVISRPDPTYRVAYLGNVVTGWAKGEGCVDKPLSTLWRNYIQSPRRGDVRMQLTVCGGGLRAATRDHGITEYWAHRLTSCAAPPNFPRLFCWVYRHEGRKPMRHELRCHAALCATAAAARRLEKELKEALELALLEFKRDKVAKQNARLSLVNSVYENPTIPRRKILLSTGSHNYKPPLERSKSAPKLTSIEEIIEEEDDIFQSSHKIYKDLLKHCDSTNNLLDKRKTYMLNNNNKILWSKDNNSVVVQSVVEEKPSKVTFSDITNCSEDIDLDEKRDMILEELVQNSMSNDLLESCEKAWYSALRDKPDLIPPDSDEGSLSSGCESSGSTAASDMDQHACDTIEEEEQQQHQQPKTDLDFKVGESVLSKVRSFEKLTSNPDILNYCNIYRGRKEMILDHEEISLVPVGESQSDFSSLRVYKKRTISEPSGGSSTTERRRSSSDEDDDGNGSDESGYEEEELVSSVANIVLV